ncbi:hypothetical protein CALCODRAFT_498924 [Calocera cornea HHB12733]|uniref:Uncharacterized protein n=1 Tax=Calocera cornea HHB12733 TaxID=1353952 RepID=A0A165ENH3_9BASI|nr:hypothetical protein CALCODRAFT_498924 [Calocera cornea HHB12733]
MQYNTGACCASPDMYPIRALSNQHHERSNNARQSLWVRYPQLVSLHPPHPHPHPHPHPLSAGRFHYPSTHSIITPIITSMRYSYIIAAVAFVVPALAYGAVEFDDDYADLARSIDIDESIDMREPEQTDVDTRSHGTHGTHSGSRVYVHFGHHGHHDRHSVGNPYLRRFRHQQFGHTAAPGRNMRLHKRPMPIERAMERRSERLVDLD